MSTVQMPERPVFNSLDPSLEAELAPPISSLAIVALVLGVLSLTAGLSVFIFPFAIFVAVLCAILIWRLSTDSTVSGIRLAQIGLFCSLLGGAWGVTTAKLTDTYYYSHASEHAKLFLQTLSAGKQYEAFELTQREPERQVTGTDIETHYKSIMATDYPVRTDMSKPEDMPSAETMKNSHAKEELVEFLDAASTKEVMTHGKDAKWEFVRGAGVLRTSDYEHRISVVMVDTTKPDKKYQIDLNRTVGQYIPQPGKTSVAIWDVDRTKVIKE